MPNNSDSLRATGASVSAGATVPSTGRPRCEVTMKEAPASSAMRIAGTDARLRVSSVIDLSFTGKFKSERKHTISPSSAPESDKEKRHLVGEILLDRRGYV